MLTKFLTKCLPLSLFMVFACNPNNEIEDWSPASINMSDKQFFRGLMFLEQDFLARLPETKKMAPNIEKFFTKPEEVEVYEGIKNVIVNRIESDEPHFFKDFRLKIQSGDHLLIEEAFITANKAVVKALDREYDIELTPAEEEALKQVDFSKLYRKDGTLDEEALTKFIAEYNSLSQKNARSGIEPYLDPDFGVVAGIVFAAYVAVIVGAAIGVVGGIAGGLVGGTAIYIVSYLDFAFPDNARTSSDRRSLASEIMLNEIATVFAVK